MATQDDIDRIAGQIANSTETVVSAEANIRADIQAIKDANPGVDLSGLEASVAPLTQAAESLRTLADENPDVLPPSDGGSTLRGPGVG